MDQPRHDHEDTAALSAVEQRRQEFEAAWEAALAMPPTAQQPRIQDYLRGLPDGAVGELLSDLLRIEFEAQSRVGRVVEADSYIELFPDRADLIRQVLGSIPTHSGAPPADPATLPEVPGFTVLRKLGRGGQAAVYLAEQHQPPRRVALKVLPRDPDLPAALWQRFQNEGQAAARLDHPNIARVWDCRYDADPMYLVTEYVPGQTLHHELASAPGSWTPQRTATFLAGVARAVQHAHERGIIHRDLKPGNILVTPAGEPRVIDFGMARRETVETGHSLTAPMTQTGEILGTPSYMAPEQADGRSDVGAPADVWAIGVILYEMLVGEKPFRGPTLAALLQAVRTSRPDWRRLHVRSIQMEAICRKCLYTEPRDRYPSAAALADDLERFARGETVRPRLLTPWESLGRWAGRNPRIAGLSGLLGVVMLLALAVTLAIYILYSGRLETALQRERHRLFNVALLHAGALGQREPWRAEELLARPEAFPEDLRDFVWGHHRACCQADRRLEGHTRTVRSLDFSPDGRWLATSDDDGVCRLWNGDTGNAVGHFNPGRGAVRLTFLTSGHLACGGSDGIVDTWDVPGGKQQRVLPGRIGSKIQALAAAGTRLAAASVGEVRLWDLATNEAPVKVFDDPLSVFSLALTPDGETLAVAGLGPRRADGGAWGRVRFWDIAAKREGQPIDLSAVIRELKFSPDGRTLAVACGDGTVRLHDAVTRKERQTLPAHDRGATCVAFAPDGWSLATGSEAEGGTDGRQPTGWLRIRRLGAAGEAIVFPAHSFNVRCVAYHPSGQQLASGGEEGEVRFFPLGDRRGGAKFSAHPEPILTLAFSPVCYQQVGNLFITNGLRRHVSVVGRRGSMYKPHDSLGFVIATAHPADLLVTDRHSAPLATALSRPAATRSSTSGTQPLGN